MSQENSNIDDNTGNVIWAVILLFGVLQIWHYIRTIMRKDEGKDYEAIIFEKDKLIEKLTEQNNILTKLIKRDTNSKKLD